MTTPPKARAPRPWWVAVVAGMASYIDAAAIVSFGIAIVIYQEVLALTATEVGVASGTLTFSIALGAIVGGRLGDRFGRRPVFTVTMAIIIAGCIALIIAPSFGVLLVGAILVGLGSGADLPVSLSTISEAAPDQSRGKMIGLSNLLWLFGALAGSVGGVALGDQGLAGAQLMFIHIGAVSLVVMILRLTIPESERWLASRRDSSTRATTPRGGTALLFSVQYRVPFFSLIGFYALVNLAANTSGQYGTYILVNVAGLDVAAAAGVALIALPLAVIGYLWFMAIVDGPHRFRYFTVGAVLYTLSQLLLASFGVTAPLFIASLVIGVFGAAFAFETIMKQWTQESFPTLARTTAQGAIIAVARVTAAGFAVVTPSLIVAGPQVLYGVLTAAVAAGMLIAWFGFRRRDAESEFDREATM